MTGIELTSDAERDLVDIFLHGVERFGLAQADRYAEMLNAKIMTAAENPSFGADYGFVRVGLRRHEAGSHAIRDIPSANATGNPCAPHPAWPHGPGSPSGLKQFLTLSFEACKVAKTAAFAVRQTLPCGCFWHDQGGGAHQELPPCRFCRCAQSMSTSDSSDYDLTPAAHLP